MKEFTTTTEILNYSNSQWDSLKKKKNQEESTLRERWEGLEKRITDQCFSEASLFYKLLFIWIPAVTCFYLQCICNEDGKESIMLKVWRLCDQMLPPEVVTNLSSYSSLHPLICPPVCWEATFCIQTDLDEYQILLSKIEDL